MRRNDHFSHRTWRPVTCNDGQLSLYGHILSGPNFNSGVHLRIVLPPSFLTSVGHLEVGFQRPSISYGMDTR